MPKLLLFFIVSIASAQTLTQTQSYPSSEIFTGASYSSPAAPHVTGWISYDPLVSKTAGIYSFNTYDVSVNKQKQLQTATTSGMGIVLKQITVGKGIFSLILTGNAGAVISATKSTSTASTSSAASLASGGTGGITYQINKSSQWSVGAFVDRENLSTGLQTIYRFGVGYSPR